ncbi:hypothetical protein SDRG_08288 [Saprolegnia diclina VS20]|uniref:Uncharacterized protein n=1 Tax=Saprolegnia diclina (strain VS20) TaxID=1156394 RepID=T0QJZ5_SAPDV|nr:hypothetical protein SDRG_08288 [Saprolegnia diclina VS20]EQC34075.1 hypothetical protein SDRG_08288 [Saprolegnia diclina VS20]|eukprot:XP_008612387.1 hypothetical protein SDRG_08288 [Saprolegnia diclina VS20]
MSAIVAVLTNPSLVQALTAYQDGVARHLSCICHRYRKQLARWARVQRHSGPAATILASPARFRCYVLFQLIKRGQFEEAHELIDEVGEEAFETPEDGHAPYLFALDKVAGCGDLALVQFLSERRLGQCTSTAMDDAAANGYVDIVRYLDEHETAGCSFVGFLLAERNGHPDVAEYLKSHRPHDQHRPPHTDSKLLYMVPVVLAPVTVGVTVAVAACTVQ